MHPSIWLEVSGASCSGSHHNQMMQRGNPTPMLIALQMQALVGLLAAMLPNVSCKRRGCALSMRLSNFC